MLKHAGQYCVECPSVRCLIDVLITGPGLWDWRGRPHRKSVLLPCRIKYAYKQQDLSLLMLTVALDEVVGVLDSQPHPHCPFWTGVTTVHVASLKGWGMIGESKVIM